MSVKTIITALFASAIIISGAKPAYAQFLYTPKAVSPLYSRDTLTMCIMGDVDISKAPVHKSLLFRDLSL